MTVLRRISLNRNGRLVAGLFLALAALLFGLTSAQAAVSQPGILSGPCALEPTGGVDCWPGNANDQNGPYTFVSRGSPTCAVRVNGDIDCWGTNDFGQAEDQTGPFSQASAGQWHSCGLKPDGSVGCWGNNDFGQSNSQAGPYTEVSLGLFHSCGLLTDGSVDCWGLNGNGQAGDHPGPYTDVDAALLYTCAILTNGDIDCWGDNFFGEGDDHTGPYVQISAYWQHNCALKPDGGVDCWGLNGNMEAENQAGAYTWVETYGDSTCALKPDGRVDCWASGVFAEDQPGPYGPFSGSSDYVFSGFFAPLENPPAINRFNAGQTVAINFSLGGDFGLGIFEAGYPLSRPVDCLTHMPIGPDRPALALGIRGFRYDQLTDVYTYGWRTAKGWAGCRDLVMRFDDGHQYTALLQFE